MCCKSCWALKQTKVCIKVKNTIKPEDQDYIYDEISNEALFPRNNDMFCDAEEGGGCIITQYLLWKIKYIIIGGTCTKNQIKEKVSKE